MFSNFTWISAPVISESFADLSSGVRTALPASNCCAFLISSRLIICFLPFLSCGMLQYRWDLESKRVKRRMRMAYRVAWIGLGVMGYPMAGHLRKKGGHAMAVNNRTAAKAARWAKEYGG